MTEIDARLASLGIVMAPGYARVSTKLDKLADAQLAEEARAAPAPPPADEELETGASSTPRPRPAKRSRPAPYDEDAWLRAAKGCERLNFQGSVSQPVSTRFSSFLDE